MKAMINISTTYFETQAGSSEIHSELMAIQNEIEELIKGRLEIVDKDFHDGLRLRISVEKCND